MEPLEHEVNIDQATTTIELLLNEPINLGALKFQTYEVAKKNITINLVILKNSKKRKENYEEVGKNTWCRTSR